MAELRRYDPIIQRLLPSLLLHGWNCQKQADAPVPGDLVMLQAAPDSDWHLSFYRECGPGESFGQKHLLESVKTGALGWWENVGFHVIDRERCRIGIDAEWSDEQFAFADTYAKARRKGDFYMSLPFIDSFDGDMVVLKFRTRHGLDGKITTLPPFPWKKATQKALLAHLVAGEAAHKEAATNG